MRLLPTLLLVLALAVVSGTRADTVRVAVASNFAETLRDLAASFEAAHTDHSVSVIVGSTGKLYAQIHHGAPFDLFFAADAARPRRLEEEGVGVSGTRATYATGRLALWIPDASEAPPDPVAWLRAGEDFTHLALANPKLAPYGAAAREALTAWGLWAGLRGRLVRGENIGQAFHFVESGAAQGGFVALSQLRKPDAPAPRGVTWVVPASLHAPVEQQVLLLRDAPGPRAFLAHVQSAEARPVLEAYGYGVPTP